VLLSEHGHVERRLVVGDHAREERLLHLTGLVPASAPSLVVLAIAAGRHDDPESDEHERAREARLADAPFHDR
jgi:hypothetical protein